MLMNFSLKRYFKTMLEKDVEKYFNKRIEEIGGLTMKFVSPNKNGVPDRIVLFSGDVHFVELKKPGEKPRPLQVKVHKEFEEQGIPVTTIDTKEGVDDFVKMITEKD